MPVTKVTPRASAEKPFSCDHCSYRTDRKANLVRHAKQHEKEDWLDLDPGNLSDVMGDVADDSSSLLTDSEQSEEETGHEQDKEGEEPQPSTSADGLEAGRVVRKPTQPAPVAAPKRKMPPPRPTPPCPPSSGDKEGGALAYAKSPEHCIPQKVPRIESTSLQLRTSVASASTSAASTSPMSSSGTQTEGVRRRKVTWICKKYKEGKKNVEEIEWEEEEFY